MSNPQRVTVPLRTREDVTGQQVDLLLVILNNLQPYLVSRDVREGSSPELDGGVVDSAVATFVKVTDRLDAILDDSARWDTKEFNVLTEAIVSAQKAHQIFLEAQTQSVREVVRPSYQCRPTLLVSEGQFVAVWGDPAIVGVGNTPHEALLDFDAAFHRTPPEQTKIVTEEPVPPTPLSVKPTKKKK